MRQVMHGALVLTLASLIAKILSALYRIPLQNLVGDEGFYVYQQVYPIYGIAMTLALSGLPQFISKYVAEKKTPLEQKDALKQVYPYVFWTGICLWLGTFGCSAQECAKADGRCSNLAPLNPNRLVHFLANAGAIDLSRKFPRTFSGRTHSSFSGC
jgi:hypothetical protein